MHIAGRGPVDGYTSDLSSSCGELQGQTALAIISKLLLEHNNTTCNVKLIGDNKGVQQKTAKILPQRIRLHSEPNLDLLLEYDAAARSLQRSVDWVKSHQDKDTPWTNLMELEQLKLSPAATLNVWCDKQAGIARTHTTSFPDVDIYPNEKWALFINTPQPRKVIGNLSENVHLQLYYDESLRYITRKHNLSEGKLKDDNLTALLKFMTMKPMHARASMAKIIHRWIPTIAHLSTQNCSHDNTCPRCLTSAEHSNHILTCPHSSTKESRTSHMYHALSEIQKATTHPSILSTLEYKLSTILEIPSQHKYIYPSTLPSQMRTAIKRQNLLGWDNFMRGYISTYWIKAQSSQSQQQKNTKGDPWDFRFTRSTLDLHKAIWDDRNSFVHGKTIAESRAKARQAIQQQVREIYKKPPCLASRYHPITSVSLSDRLRHSTTYLSNWLHRVRHQIQMSDMLLNTRPPGQLTIKQAFKNAEKRAELIRRYPP